MSCNLLVNIDVPDIEAAVRFYTAALPLTVGRRMGTDFVELLGTTSRIYLLLKTPGTVPSTFLTAKRDYARHWTPVHMDFVVDDIDAATTQAITAGARLESPVSTHAYGKLAMFADPFGHGFCLLQFVGRGYDAIATGGGATGAPNA